MIYPKCTCLECEDYRNRMLKTKPGEVITVSDHTEKEIRKNPADFYISKVEMATTCSLCHLTLNKFGLCPLGCSFPKREERRKEKPIEKDPLATSCIWCKQEEEDRNTVANFHQIRYCRIHHLKDKEIKEKNLRETIGIKSTITTNLRTFETGATRDTEEGKLDYEGFLSPFVLERFAKYMNEHRKQSDGSLRDSDNWQKGIPIKTYRSSLMRHTQSAWKLWRGGKVNEKIGGVYRPITLEDALCGILFNTMGMILEILKEKGEA